MKRLSQVPVIFIVVAIALALFGAAAFGAEPIKVRLDASKSGMTDESIAKATDRAKAIWAAAGLELEFSRGDGCTKYTDSKDLHVHLKNVSGSLGFSNAAACNTVRPSNSNPELCGSVIAHEIGHCFGLENVANGSRLMGPNAGHPTSEVTESEKRMAHGGAMRFAHECRDG